MRFVPLVHGANRLVQSVSTLDGVMPFTLNDSENPHINYRHMPVRALYELRRLVEAMLAHLGVVRRPVCLIQATHDPVVVPDSVDTLREGLTQAPVALHRVESDRHGLVAGDVADTRERIADFVSAL
jgi:esterase/lipase